MQFLPLIPTAHGYRATSARTAWLLSSLEGVMDDLRFPNSGQLFSRAVSQRVQTGLPRTRHAKKRALQSRAFHVRPQRRIVRPSAMLGALRRAASAGVRLQSALKRDSTRDCAALIHSAAITAARGGLASTRHAASAPSWARAAVGTMPSARQSRSFADEAKPKKTGETCVPTCPPYAQVFCACCHKIGDLPFLLCGRLSGSRRVPHCNSHCRSASRSLPPLSALARRHPVTGGPT